MLPSLSIVPAPHVQPIALYALLDSVRPGDPRAPLSLVSPDDAITAVEALGSPRRLNQGPDQDTRLAEAAGLMRAAGGGLNLSMAGFAFREAASPEQRNTLFARSILRHPVLHEAFRRRIAIGALGLEKVEEILVRLPAAGRIGTATEVFSAVEALARRSYARP